MADDESAVRDVLWKMYQENCTQARQHETQRSNLASPLISISAAIIGIITFDKSIATWDMPLIVLLIVVGLFGEFSQQNSMREQFYTLQEQGATATPWTLCCPEALCLR